MISTAIIFAWLHVFFAVCWIGAAVLTAVVIEPAARSFSAQASVEFVKKFIPRLGKFMGIITTFTIIFADPPSPWESLMYAGALLGIVAYIFGIVIMLPLTKKIERATKEFEANPDSANTSLQTQMSRLRSISILDLALLIAVFTLMALATYY